MNVTTGQTIAHQTLVAIEPNETLCVYSSTTTDLVIDTVGALPHAAHLPT
ncbi:MAG: hypothetical protein AAFY28_13370 [Actinomycetota bacterium]